MKEDPLIPLEKIEVLVGTSGLSSGRVGEMRTRYGANMMTPPVREPFWKQYLEKFDDPIIRILLFAVAISMAVSIVRGSGLLDTLGIIAAILLSTGIAFFNEYRSSREFDVLNAHRDEMVVKVVRDGHPVNVSSRDIVVGDLVLLEAGDAVPADGWILSSDGLVADESAFTGESEPVRKDESERLLKGTYVTAGKGRMIAAAVGDSAQMGLIAASLGIDHATPTPLERKLGELAGVISKFGYAMAILICSTLFIRGFLTGEVSGLNIDTANNILHYFMLAVVIVVAAVPEGLPMSVALSLSLAMRKMTRANCLVRRLIACETIGSATTICTDKTGTLTKNQMLVAASSAGNPTMPDSIPRTPVEWITINAAVNGTAYLDIHGEKTTVIGNSTEGALLRWLKEYGLDYANIRAEMHETRQFLFDGNRKRMSTVVIIQGKPFLLVKGAPEILAMLCTETPELDGIMALASRAMRTLAFAHKEIVNADDSETALVWDGYVGIRDQLRDNIGESVATCQKAGIRVRMVTGDNPETARAIAQESGIHKGGTVMPGPAFRALSPEEQVTAARDLDIMARAEPMDKLLLVQALQKSGDVVAVTGDGTNDAPALKHANVGFAMGIAGTEVAREASDIILLDDSFASITQAVWWGRSLYENIQRFLLFQLTINFCACILVFIAPLIGLPEPFTIIQILWINIIMDTLAAFALCSEAPHAGLLKRQPIPQDTTIITPFMWLSIIVTGAFLIIAGILQMATGFLGGSTPEEITTVFFSAFIVAAIWNGINCRALDGKMPPFFKGNPMFFVIMGMVLVLQIALVQFGGKIFSTVPLSLFQWATIIVASASVLVIGFLLRVSFRYYTGRKNPVSTD
ncbi:MAG: calcium-translocating P-type ATPase, PMCA-type [Methanoregula sp.]|uniref:calcium-translocating P-type ATPase, PMCA-type n=1 Tax=Methanoregula sp. TaxID=2052170 RepID=UPI0025E1E436|nr:calcium-translocating P-type ATPase, PMCA-type [Methanoregula sp.]MCK9630929.1 calcium-translocating P-type ATPase, PMCA-type [Methanoregula sp.]